MTVRRICPSCAHVIERERELWRQRFGGGIIPFDIAYHEALSRGVTIAEAQATGVNAVLDAFVARVKGEAMGECAEGTTENTQTCGDSVVVTIVGPAGTAAGEGRSYLEAREAARKALAELETKRGKR